MKAITGAIVILAGSVLWGFGYLVGTLNKATSSSPDTVAIAGIVIAGAGLVMTLRGWSSLKPPA